MADRRLIEYLTNMGLQPGALDRLIQKMGQTRGNRPQYGDKRTGFRGNMGALGRGRRGPV